MHDPGNLCRIARLSTGRFFSPSGGCLFRDDSPLSRTWCSFLALIQKRTKKVKAVKKRPDASGRSTDGDLDPHSQTLPTGIPTVVGIAFVGIRHEKFRSFRSGKRPGGRFFEADAAFFRVFKTGRTGKHIRRLISQSHKDSQDLTGRVRLISKFSWKIVYIRSQGSVMGPLHCVMRIA